MRFGRTSAGRAVRTSLIVFVIGSLLPAWEVIHFGATCILGESANLWRAIAAMPDCWRNTGSPDRFWHFQETNAVLAVGLVSIAIGVGLGVHWSGKRRPPTAEAEDYKDAPGGAVPDGRVGPAPL